MAKVSSSVLFFRPISPGTSIVLYISYKYCLVDLTSTVSGLLFAFGAFSANIKKENVTNVKCFSR